MSNRVIRSGFLDSEKINALKPEEQLFFVRLMLVADDYGCFDARPEMIRSACYPVSDIRLADVGKWLTTCCKVGLTAIYEVSGKKYLLIRNFDQRLRQRKRRYPEPNNLQDMSVNCQSIVSQLQATMPETETETETEGEYSPLHPAYNIANILWTSIQEAGTCMNQPDMQAWSNIFDRLHRLDKKRWHWIELVLMAARSDKFWVNNIRSPKSFREQLITKGHLDKFVPKEEDIISDEEYEKKCKGIAHDE